ncbi:MAG: SLC13 family permease [Vicinamibacterales bacterium]
MSLAWLSVAALVLAVTLSCTTTINVGVLSMALALLVGVVFGGMSPGAVIEGFPSDLLVTLVGVTLLFSISEVNGTLARLTSRAVRLCRGHAGVLPFMFFAIGLVISTIGAGATPASALLAPPAMAVAGRAGVSPFLMAIMAGNGALAGTLSPFAPTGLVAHGVMERIGLGGYEWQTYAYNALAHTAAGIGGFFLFGGWKLFSRTAGHASAEEPTHEPLETRHWLTTAGIAALIVSVAGFDVNVGMAALIIVSVLVLLRTVEEQRAIARMPWGVILMVTGVSVLIAMLQEARGLELFTSGVARVSTPGTLAPIVAFGAGVISVYSSTSGVVLPAFLPMVPDLVERVGGGLQALDVAWAMNVGASLVDLSSLSTVGALFMAGAAPGTDTRRLFNQLLAWGFSMSVAGALIAWMLFA